MLLVLGKVIKTGIIIGLAVTAFNYLGEYADNAGTTDSWRVLYYGNPMTKHEICPECDAELSEQDGFDGEYEYWICEDCGAELQHPDLYGWDEEVLVACCPFCDSDLTEQEGFDEDLPYWICKECDAVLLSPDSDCEYAWFCEDCDAFLNEQKGFREDCGLWKCKECGCVNEIDLSEVGSNGNTVCIN